MGEDELLKFIANILIIYTDIMKVSITFDREVKDNRKKEWVQEIQSVVDRLNNPNK